jgi:hypothetical protein
MGKADRKSCADAIFDNLTGTYNLDGPVDGPVPIWLLHLPIYSSQCPGLALYVNAHFQMLGIGLGEVRYCYAMPEGGYNESVFEPLSHWRVIQPGIDGHPDPTVHDDGYYKERFAMVDGGNKGNNYEATCYFESNHYALGVGRGFTTAEQVVNTAFVSVEWQYRTGSEPPYTFHACDEVPWAP